MFNFKINISIIIFVAMLSYGYGQMMKPPKAPDAGKPKYDIQLEYIEIKNYSSNHFRDVFARVKKHNRSISVITGSYETVVPFDDNFTAMIQIYAFQGNEYRAFGPRMVHERLCTKLGEDDIVYPEVLKVSNLPVLPENCPILPGKWWVKDFVAKTDNFPEVPNIAERWRCEMTLYHKETFTATGSVYMILKRT